MSRDSHGSITLSFNAEVKIDQPLEEIHDGKKLFLTFNRAEFI